MRFSYALNFGDYKCKNALLWGICEKHFQKTKSGALGNRIVHAMIGVIESLPIVGQIASVFEMVIILNFMPMPTVECAETKPLPVVIVEVPKPLPQPPTYKREKLEKLTPEQINSPIVLSDPPQEIQYYAKGVTYYGYNAEGIRDYGWGCAWRTIQTCLSAYGITIPFENLFYEFGSDNNLKKIYQRKYPNDSLSGQFAPHDLDEGWAEPFIGEMIMYFYGIPADLETVNGIPNANAPKSAFHHPSLSFSVFKGRLEAHFKKQNAAPVMIDDGLRAYNIIGIGSQDDKTILWIADPHIREGVNRTLTDRMGLYTITLNAEGDEISYSVDESQVPKMYNPASYQSLYFNNKPWMVLFPHD